MKKIGVFGGSFDPVHLGHLLLAEQAAEAAGLDRVIFMPNRTSPFKIGMSATDPEHRLAMARLAIAGNERFEVSEMEIKGSEVSYTVDTMERLHRELGPECELHFIMGEDSFLSVDKWYQAETLLRNYAYVVAVRPGYKENELKEQIRCLGSRFGTKVVVAPMPGVAISSTDVRCRLKEGRSLRYILPREVDRYAREHGLYR